MLTRRTGWLFVLLVAVTTSAAAPPPRSKPPAPKRAVVTPEMAQFATQMATAFDEVYVQVGAAQKLERAGKFSEASAKWRGVYEGSKLLTQHALRAGAAGAFQDPMTFATKAGKLTPATYLRQLRTLQARGDAAWAQADARDTQERARKARVTFVASVAVQVASLETIANDATRASKSAPEAARVALQNVVRGAASLRTSVTSAGKEKRAASNATYPVRPKPMSATELAARLTQLEKSARTAVAALDKTLAATKPKATTMVATRPQPGSRPGGAPATRTSTSAGAAPAAAEAEPAPEGPACSDAGTAHCDDGNHEPCCEGTRCLPAGWITNGTDAEGFPTVEPEYYACQDPVLAPTR